MRMRCWAGTASANGICISAPDQKLIVKIAIAIAIATGLEYLEVSQYGVAGRVLGKSLMFIKHRSKNRQPCAPEIIDVRQTLIENRSMLAETVFQKVRIGSNSVLTKYMNP